MNQGVNSYKKHQSWFIIFVNYAKPWALSGSYCLAFIRLIGAEDSGKEEIFFEIPLYRETDI